MVDRERLGLTSGFISVALWIIVYSPQIWECYVLKSGEGLSVVFLIIWLTGDITGFIGAVVQKLTLTISLLAVYYAFCDIALLYMLFYYRWQRRNHPELFTTSKHISKATHDTERTPLLVDQEQQQSLRDDDNEDAEGDSTTMQSVLRWARTHKTSLIAYALATVFIVVVGIVSWFMSAPIKHSDSDRHPLPKHDEAWSTSGQIVGWISAFLYLASRIPQIDKNRHTKCQGLSIMMFCFSVLGNVTYCGSILIPSTSPEHVYINFSWLVGSAGTIILDFIVLGQFFYYRKDRNEHVYIEGGESQISGI